MTDTGKLIVFEGPDGSGKSALAEKLRAEIAEAGGKVSLLAFPGNDDGTLGKLVYDLHHHHCERFAIETIAPDALQTLHIAAHLDAIAHRIIPLLQSGTTVILDRYWWSTVVYGSVAGLSDAILDKMIDLEKVAWADHTPLVVFFIDRPSPLYRDVEPEAWNQLRARYLRLVQREQAVQTIRVVRNDSTETVAFGAVVETLNDLL